VLDLWAGKKLPTPDDLKLKPSATDVVFKVGPNILVPFYKISVFTIVHSYGKRQTPRSSALSYSFALVRSLSLSLSLLD
jgi:hypothetical protein